ncbi:MAG TPA: GGDEF domain-containing protein [Gemmatimonadales bacterium]|nr:GGDEF domain-containing protein [Gemmatimonadales bacterium]
MWEREGGITEEELNRHERGINLVAWAGGIAVAIFTAALGLALLSHAHGTWEYAAIIGLGSVPMGYALFSNVIVRQAQVAMFQRYQGQLVLKLSELEGMASRDELTGLNNRRYFYQAVQNELGKARASREPLALILLDIDGLKAVNDEFGRAAGDAALEHLSRMIVRHTRGRDAAARTGGDEFGVVMPATDKRGAFTLARRLWEELEEEPVRTEDGRSIMLTVSIGVSGYPWGGEDLEELLQWADADLYANKLSRRLPRAAVGADRGEMDQLPEEYTTGI